MQADPSVPHTRTRQLNRYFMPVFLAVLDYLAILLAEEIAFGIRDTFDIFHHGNYGLQASYVYFWIPLIFILFLARSRAYERMKPIVDTVKQIFYSVFFGLITCIVILFFLQASLLASRFYLVVFGVLTLFNIYVLRYIVLKILKRYQLFAEPIIIVGARKTAESVLRYFEGDLGYRYKLIGIVDNNPSREVMRYGCTMVAPMNRAAEFVRDTGVQTVIITAPGMPKSMLQNLITSIQPYVRNIGYVPDLIGTPMSSVEVDTLFSEKIMLMKIRNNLARRHNRIIKRVFDLVGSILLMPILLTVILILGALIKLDSPGPAFFNAKRIGKGGKEFTCYKFRSMYVNSDEMLKKYLAEHPAAQKEWDEFAKLRGYDPRVTRIGRIIRKYSLDELPQIFNVFLGTMSLVGPRPYLPREKEDVGSDYHTICMTTPGMTGFWQVSGRNDVSFAGRVKMDVWYIRNWSIWIDLVYLFKTVKVVFGSKGAY